MKILNIRHIGIRVDRQWAATVEYWKMLGCEVVFDGFETWNQQKLHVVKLMAPGGMIIELVNGNWRNHIAVTIDHFDKRQKPTVRPDGCKVLFGMAPDKTRIEFVEEPEK